MQGDTLFFMAPDQLTGKYYMEQVKQEDLMKVDIWKVDIF